MLKELVYLGIRQPQRVESAAGRDDEDDDDEDGDDPKVESLHHAVPNRTFDIINVRSQSQLGHAAETSIVAGSSAYFDASCALSQANQGFSIQHAGHEDDLRDGPGTASIPATDWTMPSSYNATRDSTHHNHNGSQDGFMLDWEAFIESNPNIDEDEDL